MNYLLDTCSFLWLLNGSSKLTSVQRQVIADPGNLIFLSAVSAAEIAIKSSLGKLQLPESPEVYIAKNRIRHRIAELPLSESASLLLATLPWHHRDPFDRLLVAQASAHSLTLISPDPLLRLYPIQLL